jgi:hypothetical protein
VHHQSPRSRPTITMKDRKDKSFRKWRLRKFEIYLGIIIIIFALFEPLPISLFSWSPEITQETPDKSGSTTPSHEAVIDISVDENEGKGLIIHPWLPTLTMSQVKPVLREAAILLILQTIGVPIMGKFRTQLLVGARYLIPLQRRFRSLVLSRRFFSSLQKVFTSSSKFGRIISSKFGRFVQLNFRRLWKFLLNGYSKTSASKIVNRCKKYLHSFLHPNDEEDENIRHEEDSRDQTTTFVPHGGQSYGTSQSN